jgi:biopolymer transport protein ExbD
MAKTYRHIKTDDMDANFELDLSPMLALMVCLIPIMLLSTVFVKVTVIESPLPQVVQKAIDEDRKKNDREIEVSVVMKNDKTLELKVTEDGKAKVSKAFPVAEANWNFDGLRKELITVKRVYPKTFRLSLFPGEEVPYDDIVKLMDAVRKTGDDNVKLTVTDEETKESAETDIMFPDVIFGNLLEG